MLQTPMLFDAHVHLRVGEMMKAVVPLVARCCQAVIVMPNTANIRTGAEAIRHREEIRAVARRAGFPDFWPWMTVMLTDDTDPADVATWQDSGVVAGKYYPAGLYPPGGVSDLTKIEDVLREMGRAGIPLSGHFERAGVHPLNAEQAAIPDFHWVAALACVRVIFEHVSTRAALKAVRCYLHTAATITPQHLWMTADDVYDASRESIRYPHNWCRPVAKTPDDREALLDAATSEDRQIFFGSDFAPHLASSKAEVPPPAGCACYPAALSVLATLFAQHNQLDRLAGFTSGHAGDFYQVMVSLETPLKVVMRAWEVPRSITVGSRGERIIPWLAEIELPWGVV